MNINHFMCINLKWRKVAAAVMSNREELYVELGGGGTPPDPNAQMLEIIKNLQQEMVHLRTSSERLLQANTEQERLIRELTSQSIHESEDQAKNRK